MHAAHCHAACRCHSQLLRTLSLVADAPQLPALHTKPETAAAGVQGHVLCRRQASASSWLCSALQEAITLLITFRQFQLIGGEGGLRRMLPLVFAREQGVLVAAGLGKIHTEGRHNPKCVE